MGKREMSPPEFKHTGEYCQDGAPGFDPCCCACAPDDGLAAIATAALAEIEAGKSDPLAEPAKALAGHIFRHGIGLHGNNGVTLSNLMDAYRAAALAEIEEERSNG